MIQHSSEHRNAAGFCASRFKDFRGFGTCGTSGQNIINDQDSLALNGWWMSDRKRTVLVFKSLRH